MRKQSWIGLLAASILVAAGIGCGGAGGDVPVIGGGGDSGIDLNEQASARVDVDLTTGKVKVTPLGQNQGRSLYTGSAILVGSSDLSTDASELTVKKLKLQISNNTADTIGVDGDAKLIIDRLSMDEMGMLDLREFTHVDTVIGPGVSGNDGPGLGVTIGSPSGIARGEDGSIYVAGQGDGTLRRLKNGYVTRLATGLATPGGVEVLPGSNFAFVVEQSTHNLVRLPIDGGSKFVIAGGGAAGLVDGSGATARFDGPRDLAILGGNAYVADYNNDRIRKVTNLTGGSATVSTLNVFPAIASPSGISAMNHGGVDWLVVCSTQTHKVFLVNSANGQSFQIAGTGATGSVNGAGNVATFSQPSDVAVVGSSIFVAEIGNRAIRQISLKTGADPKFASSWVVKTVAGLNGSGSVDGLGNVASFASPRYLAVDGSGAIYATDLSNNSTRKITPTSGVLPITGGGELGIPNVTVANPDSFIPDPAQHIRKAVFNLGTLAPKGTQGSMVEREIEFLVNGYAPSFYFFVSLAGAGSSIGALDAVRNTTSPFRGSSNVNVRTLTGNAAGYADGSSLVARFGPDSKVFATAKAVYVADQFNSAIRRLDLATGVTTTILGGNGGPANSGVGTGAITPNPGCIWVNEDETEGYFAGGNVIMRMSRQSFTDPNDSNAWTASIVVGAPGVSAMTNGFGDDARIGDVQGIAGDATGSFVYFSDRAYNQIRIMRVIGSNDRDTASNWQVALAAGSPTGDPGDDNDFGTGARFEGPMGIALSKDGYLYIAEGAANRIRRMTFAFSVMSVAGALDGTPGMVDSGGSSVRFNNPVSITLDNSGYLYVTDKNNKLIRRVAIVDGYTSTVAGYSDGVGSSDGAGNTVGFSTLSGLSFVPGRGLYATDYSRVFLVERVVRNGKP